jgi:hypothetical protein
MLPSFARRQKMSAGGNLLLDIVQPGTDNQLVVDHATL